MNDADQLRSPAPVPIQKSVLQQFSEVLVLRDPKGRSRTPHIVETNDELIVRGDFRLRHTYQVTAPQGHSFVDVMRDPNLIHREGNIVPGAYTVSKAVLPLEILFPRMRIRTVKAKFTQASYYGRRTQNIAEWRFLEDDRIEVDILSRQGDTPIARTIVRATLPETDPEPAPKSKANRDQVEKVATFIDALNIPADLYWHSGSEENYTYPIAYLLGLPSGEFVRQLSGQGGLLNTLHLDFEEAPRIPIRSAEDPRVDTIYKPKKQHTFQRILTKIVEGLSTICKGTALVRPTVEPGDESAS